MDYLATNGHEWVLRLPNGAPYPDDAPFVRREQQRREALRNGWKWPDVPVEQEGEDEQVG
jgi:hypothetical protein